jgi:hypothetical protein
MKGEGAPIASRASPERLLSILHENPHMLDGGETDFSVNTGKQLILVDAGGGVRFGGGTLGRFAASLRSAGCTPEDVDIVLATHPPTPITSEALPLKTESAPFQMPRSTSRRSKATFGCRPKSRLSLR